MNTKSDEGIAAIRSSSDLNMEDSMIKSVQSFTRSLIGSFRDKTEMLTNCSDLKLLLREGYKTDIALEASRKFFGNKKVSFVAIDGTESQDEYLDMLIFYVGAFGYAGQLEFPENGCSCGDVIEAKHATNISTAIPIFEGDASRTVGRQTENGIEVDAEKLPSAPMQFAEYYLAPQMIAWQQ